MAHSSRKHIWVKGRSAHRQRSHDEAHAGAADAPLPPVLDHPLVPAGEPAIIASQAALDAHIADLRAAGRFAYDTEFIGEHSYHPKLCLIQTATPHAVAVIDPLIEGLNLQTLWELLGDADIEKVVHAGEQDLEPVVRCGGCAPANVFDTQVVAAFAGCGYPTGMRRLVSEVLGADAGHALTFSQWDSRPLSRVQMLYAGNDVRYLPLLRATLAEKAESLSNLAWARDECQALCAVERYQVDPAAQRLRVRGMELLTPRELEVLTRLIAWRERAAEAQDIPPRALVRDAILLDLARNPVHKVGDLDRVAGLPRPVENRWGEAIVQATREGLAAPLDGESTHVPFDRWAHRRRIDELWEAAAALCRARQVDPAIATSKREIGHFVRATAAGVHHHTAAGRLLRGWRRELFEPLFS